MNAMNLLTDVAGLRVGDLTNPRLYWRRARPGRLFEGPSMVQASLFDLASSGDKDRALVSPQAGFGHDAAVSVASASVGRFAVRTGDRLAAAGVSA